MRMADGWGGRSRAQGGNNTKITDRYRIDTISISRSKWISLKGRVENIAKGDRWIWFWAIGGIFLGMLIMALFGVYYSGGTVKHVNETFIIYNNTTVDLWWLGAGDQPVFHVYWSVLLAAIFGMICWFFSLFAVLKPIRGESMEILSEMEDLDRKKAVQEESTTR